MVTVRELIEELLAYPFDTPVIISVDEEGNELRMLNGVGMRYVEELQHRFMSEVAEEDLEHFDNPVLTVEIW